MKGCAVMNVFMILSDELRADTLGCMGNDIIRTPHIDAFAKDAVVFENAYCNTPMCVPSRNSIATGRYAHSHGALDNMLSPLDDEVSFYSILQENGYRTLSEGKWHCNISPRDFGVAEDNQGNHQVSDVEKLVTCFGITDSELRKNTEHKRNNGEVPLIISGKRPTHKDHTLDAVKTKNYLDALETIKDSQQPVFARLSIMDPHTPYIPSEPYASMYDPQTLPLPESFDEDLKSKPVLHQYFKEVRGFNLLEEEDYRKSKASYYGLVSHVDDHVGKVIDRLKALDLYEDSIIMFVADHGSMMGEHGFIEKWGHMYEQVMRIPLMIKMPKGQNAGKHLESFVESVDFMPTLLSMLGMDVPENVQGKNLVPYMNGETQSHKDEVYGQYYCGSIQNESALMVRDAKWKLTSYPEGNRLEGYLFNDHPLKMSSMFNEASALGELYDMTKDPGETNNLFDDPAYRDVRTTYMEKLATWMDGMGDIVDANTMPEKNTMSMHVIKQGENMKPVQECMAGTGRWGQLKRIVK